MAFLRRQLLGPLDGPLETISDPPRVRYLLGVLFPQQSVRSETLVDEEDDGLEGADQEGAADAPVVAADDWLPSSLGISFFVRARSLECGVWAARYVEQPSGRARRWARIPIAEADEPELVFLSSDDASTRVVLEGRARLTSVWRPYKGGFLVTVALANASIIEVDESGKLTDEQRQRQDAECLHQVGFSCTPLDGAILEYPTIDETFRDEEEEELRLLYAHAGVYGVGHGCSINWSDPENGKTKSVSTEHLPSHDVPPLSYDLDGFEDILTLGNLVLFEKTKLIGRLTEFVMAYEEWADSLASQIVPARFEAAKTRILARTAEAVARMHNGVRYIEEHEDALEAFRLANRAMLMQMHQSRKVIAEKTYSRNQAPFAPLDLASAGYTWRPFQLAFQLLTLESTAERDSAERDVVDLIWFPTGGGKTEAYLGLAAFIIFLRRLRFGERGAGTTVLTRYTLTLLTAQQFQRAATLICACERLRRSDPGRLGGRPIVIGLWIGDKLTPNRLVNAREQFDALLDEEEPRNPFQLQQCAWCGTSIVPERRSADSADYGIRSSDALFEFYCPTDACPFHDILPIGVIDQALYRDPPTLLLATVDKFAQLPWDERAGVFFGGAHFDSPSLIIQDELHLLSGPLGTTVGLYETGIETLIALNGGKPKIVASTATIRRAPEQVAGLFGRPQTRVFPPSGLDSRDSFYARASSKPGRRYVGILPQSHSTQTSVVNAASALLQAPLSCELEGAELDAMWTLVVYHNSLRELGRTINLARDDIPERIKAWAGKNGRDISDDGVMELRSNLDGAALPQRLQRLKSPYGSPDVLSVVGCTNMFSVGVDVQRLGLMLMNGQPKSTSEYIQATSRVGRGAAAGMVVALYGATRPRDRSHYEQFRAFHSSLYMRVEPTSVTPFSPPSRTRALHAVFVMLMRHWGGLDLDNEAGGFDKNLPAVGRIRRALENRVRSIDPDEEAATLTEFDELVEEWDSLAKECAAAKKPLFYRSAGKSHRNLLAHFGKRSTGLWPTLTSMRNVDAECGLAILGATSWQP